VVADRAVASQSAQRREERANDPRQSNLRLRLERKANRNKGEKVTHASLCALSTRQSPQVLQTLMEDTTGTTRRDKSRRVSPGNTTCHSVSNNSAHAQRKRCEFCDTFAFIQAAHDPGGVKCAAEPSTQPDWFIALMGMRRDSAVVLMDMLQSIPSGDEIPDTYGIRRRATQCQERRKVSRSSVAGDGERLKHVAVLYRLPTHNSNKSLT
jgi:hypothetical protein